MRVPAIRRFRIRRLHLRRIVLGDLWLKTAAIAMAVLLWVAALEAFPREVTSDFDGRVPVERPEVPVGYVLRGELGDVGVRLRGPEAAVAGIAQQELRATVDLSGIDSARPEPQEVPVRVAVSDARVKVVEVIPATIKLRLERLTDRVIAVQPQLANRPPSGHQAGGVTIRPAEVRVSGPASDVAAVAAVLATVRFGDAPVDLAQSVQPIAVDAAGLPVDGVQVDPISVQVSVPVLSSATTRTVPVLWQLRGTVATGYWISRVAAEPAAVTVRGERDPLAALERIETAPIDVGGLSAPRSFAVALVLPPGFALVDRVEARVTVTVVALSGTRPFPSVAVRASGLGSGLQAEIEPPIVEVVLAGTMPVLAGLSADAVTATVDVSGRGPGTHTLDIVVRVPLGTTLSDARPTRVTVTIRQRQ